LSKYRLQLFLLLAYALFLAGASARLQRISAHSTSRLATIDSLAARSTFAINDSLYFGTIDKVKIGANYYSHQPPGHALLAAIVYLPLYHLGIRFSQGPNAAYAILIFATNGLSTVIALVLFFRALAWLKVPDRTRLLLTAGVACGTLVLPYSTTLNVHGLDAAILLAGFYCFVRGGIPDASRRWMLLSGLCFSLCAALEHGTLFLYAAFSVLILVCRDRRASLLWFLLPSVVTLAPTEAYYYLVGGSLQPFGGRPELFVYPGSVWVDPSSHAYEQLTGTGWNSLGFALRYGFLCLLGPRGFLIYNPLVWIALYGMARTIARRQAFWREAIAIAAGSTMMIAYFAFVSTNYSGGCYSIRWFVPLLFLWWFFAGSACDWLASRKWTVAILAPVSVFYAVAGVEDPWPSRSGFSTPFVNVSRALHGMTHHQ
jgi:hypothetical protein